MVNDQPVFTGVRIDRAKYPGGAPAIYANPTTFIDAECRIQLEAVAYKPRPTG